jgi:KEOPS complex subunit Cgi121
MRLVEGMVHIADDEGGGDAGSDGGSAPPDSVPVFDDVDMLIARLGEIADEHGVTVQAFDAGLVVDRRHLERAVELADRERARGDGIARDRAVEILLYAAGRRQIDRAFEMGVGPGATPAVVLVDAPPGSDTDGDDGEAADERAAAEAVRELLEPAGTLGDCDPERVRAFFDIGADELAATAADLPALVHERVALLVVER